MTLWNKSLEENHKDIIFSEAEKKAIKCFINFSF